MLYTGETVRITNTATDFDGSALDDTKVARVTVTIFDSASAVVLAETDMAWSTQALLWYFDWDTSGRPAGGYKALIRLYGVSGGESFEVTSIRLRQPPVPVS